jgi:hypothetical protein
VLQEVEPSAWRDAVAAGLAPEWRWRAGRTPTLELPYIELRREGRFDEAQLVALSDALSCPASAVELTSGGAPFRWAEANRGVLDDTGVGVGSEELIKVLFRAVFFMTEGPGLIFGRGNDGWNQNTRE